jgi:hypothetical protein
VKLIITDKGGDEGGRSIDRATRYFLANPRSAGHKTPNLPLAKLASDFTIFANAWDEAETNCSYSIAIGDPGAMETVQPGPSP